MSLYNCACCVLLIGLIDSGNFLLMIICLLNLVLAAWACKMYCCIGRWQDSLLYLSRLCNSKVRKCINVFGSTL